jgi:hypothetical protein
VRINSKVLEFISQGGLARSEGEGKDLWLSLQLLKGLLFRRISLFYVALEFRAKSILFICSFV